MKSILLTLTFFLAIQFGQAQETFPISPVGPQRVFPGAKIMTNLSAVNHDLSSITLSGMNLPNFGSFQDLGKGFGTFIFEPDVADIGEYVVSLQAISGTDTSLISFQVTVPNLPTGMKYYVDPENGDINNPGTESQPWSTLYDIFQNGKTFQSNDIIYLRTGNHGTPTISGMQDSETYILAEKGHTPMMEELNLFFAKNWVVSGIKITPEAADTSAKGNYFHIKSACTDITIENCEIYGTSDVMNWTTNQDWYDNAGDGVQISGENTTFRNNYIYNVYFGLSVDQPNNIISYNLLNNYGGDGFRGIASDCQFLYNRIQNALVDDYDTGNHDDGFQSWTFGASIKNVVLKGNQIFSHTDPTLPLKTSILQGLVNFDGFSERWIVEDNLVLTDHPHGITLLGASYCKVANNTVINNPLQLFSYGNPPWIRVGPHKNTSKSLGNLIRNNLMAFNYAEGDPGNFDHNLIANYNEYFVDYAHWNFHLKPGSAPINQGTFIDGSTKDNSQRIRFDSIPDIGAYEFGNRPYDYENPSMVSNIQTLDILPTSVKIDWSPSTDNYIIKRYIIQSAGIDKIITDTITAEILGLTPNTAYAFDIQAEDYAGNLSESVTYHVTTPNMPADTMLITVPAHPYDIAIKSNSTLFWPGLQNHTIGGHTYFYDAAAAIPFRLPTIPSGYKIINSNLTVALNRIVNSPFGNADLYALNLANAPTISVNDNWQGEFGTNPSGIALEDNFLDQNKSLGQIKTADTTGVKLTNYLNDQSSLINKYLIFRINSDKEDASNYRFYQIASADHPNTEVRPMLQLQLANTVGLETINSSVLQVFPNPITELEEMTINWQEQLLGSTVTLTITSIDGRTIFRKTYENNQNSLKINSDILTKSGIYFLSINDKKTYLTAKIIR